jgi:hypothetical protein
MEECDWQAEQNVISAFRKTKAFKELVKGEKERIEQDRTILATKLNNAVGKVSPTRPPNLRRKPDWRHRV